MGLGFRYFDGTGDPGICGIFRKRTESVRSWSPLEGLAIFRWLRGQPLTAEALGKPGRTAFYDVGVAGLHRLVAHMDTIMSARVIIAIAGMEGALASVIGGLADCPVIAVPTSIGYGAPFHGVSALLSMLNSYASGSVW